MTGVERELLEIIAAPGGGTVFSGLSSVEASALNVLERGGLIESRPDVSSGSAFQIAKVYRITDAGRLALQAADEAVEQEVQRRAEEQAEKERDQLQSESGESRKFRFSLYSSIIGAIIGSVAAFILAHFSRIMALLKRIFGL